LPLPTGNPRCGNSATVAAYKEGVAYAVQQFAAQAPSVAMYLDMAHGGWLGWRQSLSTHIQNLIELDVLDKVRGFATNTANYQTLGVQCPDIDWCLNGQHAGDACCSKDPCKLLTQYNSANNEHNYALLVANMTSAAVPGFKPRFIIDTGRNGGPGDERSQCANWCNIRDAGLGLLPTAESQYPDMIDAYLWLKTPGESDGCTQTLPSGGMCKRYDSMCGSVDSIGSRDGEPRAPEAGKWFDYQVSSKFRLLGSRGSAAKAAGGPISTLPQGLTARTDEACAPAA
jgi:cellulose 1,4-beta-cellobiosidase